MVKLIEIREHVRWDLAKSWKTWRASSSYLTEQQGKLQEIQVILTFSVTDCFNNGLLWFILQKKLFSKSKRKSLLLFT